MPRRHVPLKKANAFSCASNTISWLSRGRLGRTTCGCGRGEPGNARLRRRTSDHDDLVAPVELVGLARCEHQWHEGLRGALAGPPLPASCVTAHGIIAAEITALAQPFVETQERQPLPLRFGRILLQQPLQRRDMGPELRHRLLAMIVAPLRRIGLLLRSNDVTYRVASQPILTRDRPDWLLLHEECSANLPFCVHCNHPREALDATRALQGHLRHSGDGSNLDADQPRNGVKIPRRSTECSSR